MVIIARISDHWLLRSPYTPIVLYIGTARNAAGMKYVKSARFIMSRPPFTLSRLIANAAHGGDHQRQHADRDRDDQRVPHLQPEVVEIVVLLA